MACGPMVETVRVALAVVVVLLSGTEVGFIEQVISGVEDDGMSAQERFTVPVKPFFAVTSAFLYYMAFVFAGKGVAELQEGGTIGTTVAPWAPRIPALGIYPTAESLVAQGVLVLLALAALLWTFVIAPGRGRPDATKPDPSAQTPSPPAELPVPTPDR